jgi:hypothetical protein
MKKPPDDSRRDAMPDRVWLFRVGGEGAVLEVGRAREGPWTKEAEYVRASLHEALTDRLAAIEAEIRIALNAGFTPTAASCDEAWAMWQKGSPATAPPPCEEK